eukprot:1190140-Prorocentrum_minimum.AAC.2
MAVSARHVCGVLLKLTGSGANCWCEVGLGGDSLCQRFTFTPVRGAAANKKDPKMIPIGPADGLEMMIE